MTHAQETSPLAQAFAAIIAMLIAAIAEHAREHPMLGGPCRASIRQLEKIAKRFEALANEWHQSQTETRPNPPKPRPPGARLAIHMETKRRRKEASLRLCVVMWNPRPPARAPPPSRHQRKEAKRPSLRRFVSM
jgi:hypothetical protein